MRPVDWLHINANPEPGDSIPGSQIIALNDQAYAQVIELVA